MAVKRLDHRAQPLFQSLKRDGKPKRIQASKETEAVLLCTKSAGSGQYLTRTVLRTTTPITSEAYSTMATALAPRALPSGTTTPATARASQTRASSRICLWTPAPPPFPRTTYLWRWPTIQLISTNGTSAGLPSWWIGRTLQP